MYTQCPDCTSIFQISPEHLGAASGMVRCGVCDSTFNALRRLTEEPPEEDISGKPEGDATIVATAPPVTEPESASPTDSTETTLEARLSTGHTEDLFSADFDMPVHPDTDIDTYIGGPKAVEVDGSATDEQTAQIVADDPPAAEQPEADASLLSDDSPEEPLPERTEQLDSQHEERPDDAEAEPTTTDEFAESADEDDPFGDTDIIDLIGDDDDIDTDDLFGTSQVLEEWDIEEGEQDLEALLADESFLEESDETGSEAEKPSENTHETAEADEQDGEVTDDSAESDEDENENEDEKEDEKEDDDAKNAREDAVHSLDEDREASNPDESESALAFYADLDEDLDSEELEEELEEELARELDENEDVAESAMADGSDDADAATPDPESSSARVAKTEDRNDDAQSADDRDSTESGIDQLTDTEPELNDGEPSDLDAPSEAGEEVDDESVEDDFAVAAEAETTEGETDSAERASSEHDPDEDHSPIASDATETDDKDALAELEEEPLENSEAILTSGVDGQFEEDYNADADDLKDLGDYLSPKKSLGRRLGEASLLALLLGALGGQFVHYNRAELATHPVAGKHVRTLYATLGQELRIDWRISDYRVARHTIVPGSAQPDLLQARATIVNNTEHDRPLPLVRLQLNNRWGDAIYGRVFSPDEYLEGEIPEFLAGKARLEVNLDLVHPAPEDEIGYNFDICLDAPAGPDCGAEEVFRE